MRGRTASASSPRARTTSGSSERTWTMADWTALRRLSPSATRPPARINIRVEDTSRSGEPSRFLMALPSVTRARAVSASTPGFVSNHFRLGIGGREVEFDGDESLTGRFLDVLQDALVAGVVGDHQLKARRRRQCRAEPIDRKLTAVIGERMDDHDGVLARLHHLVQIADGSVADGPGQRPIHPHRFSALEQEAAHQIRRGHVFVPRNGDQTATELVGHRLDEASLSASRRALQQHRQTAAGRRAEDVHLVAERTVKRRFRTGLSRDVVAVGRQSSFPVGRGRCVAARRPPEGRVGRRC